MDFDDLLESELKQEASAKDRGSFDIVQTHDGDRVMTSNELIRQRLMDTLKNKTIGDADNLKQENKIQNTDFSLSNQSDAEEVDVEELSELYADSLSTLMQGTNQALAKKMDLSDDLPNIDRVSLSEYILVEGPYTNLFSEFIMDDRAIPKGVVPLCIKMQDKVIMLKEIQATPDILFKMKYFLEGFIFSLFRDSQIQELDIFEYLGKLQID